LVSRARFTGMRPIGHEAERLRFALKTIAGYNNTAVAQEDGAQAAARLARETLEDLKLFHESDAEGV
jgi:hypothetical protein